MSCCGGNCGCGSDCKCGHGCSGCKMYPDMSYAEESSNSSETLVFGVAAPKKEYVFEGAAENGGCECGSNCTCNPCTCNK
ncbi:metallothionein-like protein 2 [Apium graveolens]|uniref:metallothionein-like protein 2 n=1 Tax=Apium graveolens TaxID=4045 RepID=UPI003D7A55CC